MTIRRIDPVAGNASRPTISVVVPTYEPGQHLIAALRSVLQQDPGAGHMQIAVVDDDSRAVDVEALVAQADPAGRIEILRLPANHGLAGNWNRCIDVARGQIVHILHQDDWIADGF